MLDSNSLLPGSSDLLAQANVPHFKKRLDDSWRDETPARQAENQEKFLRVVVAAMSVTQTEFSNNFLRESTEFPTAATKQFIERLDDAERARK
ncbi:hypothetical protein AAVH_22266 [Aphelenchoides avenae]|nr:hypothetical protein AAVH_22266 [Aphelenchus avenae]